MIAVRRFFRVITRWHHFMHPQYGRYYINLVIRFEEESDLIGRGSLHFEHTLNLVKPFQLIQRDIKLHAAFVNRHEP